MTELMDAIKGRRSIRSYQDKEIPEDILMQILESIRWSPSWANTQCWEAIVVRDPVMKEKLQDCLGPKNPARKAMIQAPIILGICGRLKRSGFYKDKADTKFGDWFMFDLGLATQNVCLTAHGLGLGTVIAGAFDHNKAKKILGMGPDFELVVLLPLGYPAKEASAPKRRDIEEYVHYEIFKGSISNA
jgi:nitroreductase